MKKILFFICFCHTIFSYAQQLIKGTIKNSKGEAIYGASVYLDNTTIGTISKSDGSFELPIKKGNFELIISFLGYKTIQQKINSSTFKSLLAFVLVTETNFLNEAVVTKTIYDDTWKHNLESFKKDFLGRTKLAATCEILNPKTLHFEYDVLTRVFTASVKEPLQIKNNGLGYLIEYDLINFQKDKNSISYLGRTKYTPLKGGKSKQKRWFKNRRKAFNGSRMHFVRSMRKKNLKEEGYIVNQFKRIKNEERPSEVAIKKARNIIRQHRTGLNFNKMISNPTTKLDSALLITRKARLPKFRDYLYKKNVPYEDMITKEGEQIIINFKNYLSIIYTKEPEEDNYLYVNTFKKKKATGMQTSAITLTTDMAILDPSGEIIEPLAYFSEGYWGYEQFADTLPLDYQPPKD